MLKLRRCSEPAHLSQVRRAFRSTYEHSNSALFSLVSKGISSHLMKASAKRRRSRKQIKEDEEQKEFEKAETARKIQRLAQLEQEHAAL